MSTLALCAVLAAAGVWLAEPNVARDPRRAVALRSRPAPPNTAPGLRLPDILVAEVLAAVVEAGAAPETAAWRLSRAMAAVGDPRAAGVHRLSAGAGSAPPEGDRLLTELTAGLALSARTGVAPAEFLRRAGRRAQLRDAERVGAAVSRLPVLLVLPAGLCLLPAAFLIAIVPVVLDLAQHVLGAP